MAKRRTKKQKASAKHPTSINWNDLRLANEQKSRLTEADVKGQNKNGVSLITPTSNKTKNANYMEKEGDLRSIKIDLLKSILISIFIVALEMMLYLSWV